MNHICLMRRLMWDTSLHWNETPHCRVKGAAHYHNISESMS